MYYGGICDSDNSFCLSSCLRALSIWQIGCVMYNMTNFGQINNFLVIVLVLVLHYSLLSYLLSIDRYAGIYRHDTGPCGYTNQPWAPSLASWLLHNSYLH